MAGYLIDRDGYNKLQFNLHDPNLLSNIANANDSQRVMILQLDGDELAAALWGLKNYNNKEPAAYLIVHSERPHIKLFNQDELQHVLRSLNQKHT